MAVAFDASAESTTGTGGATGSHSWTHTPVGTPRCAVVFMFGSGANGHLLDVVSITYGGVAMTQVGALSAIDNLTEPGRADVYFLDNCPAGAQTVIVTRTTDAAAFSYGVSVTLTAAGATEIYTTGAVVQQGDGAIAQVNVDDGSPGTDSLRLAGAYTGAAAPASAGANSTLLQSIDLGAYGCSVARETTAGQGSRPVGLVAGSDDRAYTAFAVREVSAAAPEVLLAYTGGGYYV